MSKGFAAVVDGYAKKTVSIYRAKPGAQVSVADAMFRADENGEIVLPDALGEQLGLTRLRMHPEVEALSVVDGDIVIKRWSYLPADETPAAQSDPAPAPAVDPVALSVFMTKPGAQIAVADAVFKADEHGEVVLPDAIGAQLGFARLRTAPAAETGADASETGDPGDELNAAEPGAETAADASEKVTETETPAPGADDAPATADASATGTAPADPNPASAADEKPSTRPAAKPNAGRHRGR